MSIPLANVVVVVTAGYLLVGALFALAFAFKGASRVDHAASGTPLLFKLLILPASAALWPWLAARWARGATANPALADARRLRRRHVVSWLLLGPAALVGLALAVWWRGSSGVNL